MYYYIDVHNEPSGPVPADQLELFGVTPETYVWKAGMSQWVKAGEVDELGEIFKLTHIIPNEVIRVLEQNRPGNEMDSSLIRWIVCSLIAIIISLMVTVGVVYNNKICKERTVENTDGNTEKNTVDTISGKYQTIEIIKEKF